MSVSKSIRGYVMNKFVRVSGAVSVEILQQTKCALHGLHGLGGLQSAF